MAKEKKWTAPKEQKHYGVYYEDNGLTPELNAYADNNTFQYLISIENDICVKLEGIMFELLLKDDRLDADEIASLEREHVKAKRSLVVGRNRGVTIVYKRDGDERPRQKSEILMQCLDYHFTALHELMRKWRTELVAIARYLRSESRHTSDMLDVPALHERYPLFDIDSALEDADDFKSSYYSGRYRGLPADWMWQVTKDAKREDIALFSMELGLHYNLNGVQVNKVLDGLLGVLTERIELKVERIAKRRAERKKERRIARKLARIGAPTNGESLISVDDLFAESLNG